MHSVRSTTCYSGLCTAVDSSNLEVNLRKVLKSFLTSKNHLEYIVFVHSVDFYWASIKCQALGKQQDLVELQSFSIEVDNSISTFLTVYQRICWLSLISASVNILLSRQRICSKWSDFYLLMLLCNFPAQGQRVVIIIQTCCQFHEKL